MGIVDYLTGLTVILEKNDPTYGVWKAETDMVMSWLINNDIGENFVLCKTAQEI